MKFTVVWSASAERELASLWLSAADRAQVAAAADEIDASLAREPLSFGESRGANTRIAIAAPLTVVFDVDEPNRLVRVWDLWRRP
jgi:plasmid stabilization system protein ParE